MATLLGLDPTLALLAIGDQGNLEAIGTADQTGRLNGSNAALFSPEGGLQFTVLLSGADRLAFSLEESPKDLV